MLSVKILLADKEMLLQYENSIRQLMECSYILNFGNNVDVVEQQKERYKNLLNYHEQGQANVAIAFVKDVFVGYVWFFKISKERVHLNEIAVIDEFNSQGIGKKLIEFVELYAKKEGIECVELYCMESNIRANNFYLKNNYKTEKRLYIKKV